MLNFKESNYSRTLFERICERFGYYGQFRDEYEMKDMFDVYVDELLHKPDLKECSFYQEFIKRVNNGQYVTDLFAEWMQHYASDGVFYNYDAYELHDSNTCECIG